MKSVLDFTKLSKLIIKKNLFIKKILKNSLIIFPNIW